MQIGRYRDNHQGDRSTKQLEQYFDYDAWNDQMNKRKPQKRKADARKKRNKIFKL